MTRPCGHNPPQWSSCSICRRCADPSPLGLALRRKWGEADEPDPGCPPGLPALAGVSTRCFLDGVELTPEQAAYLDHRLAHHDGFVEPHFLAEVREGKRPAAAGPREAPMKSYGTDRSTWPFWARAAAALRAAADGGLGDTVARNLATLGADALKDLYRLATGGDCGCAERQERLNRMFPYTPEGS